MTLAAFWSTWAEGLNPDPEALIPWLQEAPAGAPESWPRSAVLEWFTADGQSQHRGIPAATRLHLAHDGSTLYAVWECADPDGLPQVPKRDSRSDLTLDESVQLVLGLPGDAIRTEMQMGGYAGAQGIELAPVKQDYEFTVNAAGSHARSYDETPLPQPRFDATATPKPGGYRIRMAIPLASAGITVDGETELYFNAFRFYRATRYGWFLPAFGNYARMPYGRIRLAAPGSTVDGKKERAVIAAPKASTPRKPKLADVTATYYPLSRKLCAVFPADPEQRTARLECAAAGAAVEAKLAANAPTTLTLPLPSLPEQAAAEAVVRLGGEHRNVPFTPLAPPDWYGTAAAKEYRTQKVPAPWSAPEWLPDGQLQLSHARFRFGAGALPEQFEVNGHSLLAAPIRIEAVTDNGAVVPVPTDPQHTGSATRQELQTAAAAAMQLRTLVEYDGFTIVRIRFPELDARKIAKLDVIIPLAPGVAKYLNRGLVQTTSVLGVPEYQGNGGDIWAGNESFGLSVSGDRTWFFSSKNGRQIQLIPRADGGADLVLHLVDGAGQLGSAERAIQFFLLPTPSRREAPPPEENRMKLLFEEWSDYQGYPDLGKLPLVRSRADEAHAGGDKLYLYFSQCLAENAPEADRWSIEWFAPPDRPWYRRAYDPGKGVACHVSCFRGAAGDLLLDRIVTLRDEGKIDGVYLDGPSNPFDCANPSHQCDDALPVDFSDDAETGRVLGQRLFLKRLRGIFDAVGSTEPLWVHTGGALDLPTLSLTDYLYEGEQLARYHQGYMLEPEKFVIGYSGRPFGFRSLFLPMIFSDAGGIKRALAWGLVHDVETSLGGHPHYSSPVQESFFGLPRRDATARFFPYWEEQPQLRRLSDTPLLISYYRGDTGTMLVLANLRYEGTQEAVLDVTELLPPAWQITELTAPEPVGLEPGNVLRVAVPEGAFRLFAFTPADAAPAAPVRAEATAASPAVGVPSWQLLRGNRETADETAGMLVFSGAPGEVEAQAALTEALPEGFELRFPLRHGDCFRLRFRGIAVDFDSWEGWKVAGMDQGDYLGRCHAYARWLNGGFEHASNETVMMTLRSRDGRVSLRYGDMELLEDVLPAQPDGDRTVRMETWSGRKLFLGTPQLSAEFSEAPPESPHPVR